jgi:hypothetical protein
LLLFTGTCAALKKGHSHSAIFYLCAALRCRYTTSQLVEVNAHSLFSKWFSESGKLVSKLFAAITELVEEPQALVFVLIDEVESLSAARKVRLRGRYCQVIGEGGVNLTSSNGATLQPLCPDPEEVAAGS